MANRRSNYGMYGGYGGYGGWNHLIAGMRNRQTTLPNVGGMFMQGLRDARKMNELNILEKRLKLQEQEKSVIDALNNEAWSPDVSEYSPWAQQIITDNLIDMKNQYFEATKKGLGSNVSVANRAEAVRLQKEIMSATAKMGGDLLDLDNFTQEYMDNHGNLSWAGGKKEKFLNYIDKNAIKRVDQKTGAVYITPVGGTKDDEISMKEFKKMFPIQIPNDLFDAMEQTATSQRELFWKGHHGKDLPGTKYNELRDGGLIEALKTDIRKNINVVNNRDDGADRNDLILSLIEDMDTKHGNKFMEDENRYAELQREWEALEYKGQWIHGDDAQLLELRKKTVDNDNIDDFKSLEDEYINWEAEQYFTWITGQKAPTKPPSISDQAELIRANTAAYAAKNARMKMLFEQLGENEKENSVLIRDWIEGKYVLNLKKDINGRLVSKINVGGKIIDGKINELIKNSGLPIETQTEINNNILNHFSSSTNNNADFDIISSNELLNNLGGLSEGDDSIDITVTSGGLKNSWNAGADGVAVIDDNIIMPGDVIQITRTGPTGTGISGKSFPVKTQKEIADGKKGDEDYYARVVAHIEGKNVQTTSGKSQTTSHPPIIYNGDLQHFVQQLVQAFTDEEFIPAKTQEQINIDKAKEKELLKTIEKLT